MEKREKKINFHLASNDDGLFFWDRVRFSTIQKWILALAIVLAVLPIFVSITVKPWLVMIRGREAANFVFFMIAGEYWFSLVYILGAAMGFFLLLGALQKYKGCRLTCLGQKKWLLSHWLCINMLLLLIWSFLSYSQAADKELALWGDYYCHEGMLLFLFYAVFFLAGSWLNGKQMKITAEILTAVCAFTGVLVITKGELIPGLFYMDNNREVMFHQYNHYGYFLAICAPLAMGLTLQDEKPSILLGMVRTAELWLIFNAMAVNETRGSFLAVVCVLIFWNFYIFILRKDLIKRLLMLDVLFVITFAFMNIGSQLLVRFGRLAENFENLATAENKQEAFDQVGTLRGMLWRHGMEFAAEKPLFGYGPGNLEVPYSRVNSETFSPHSDVVLIAASLGFPALYFYLSGLAGHLVGFFRYVKSMSVFEVTVYASVAGYLASSLTGVSMFYTAPYYFLMLGFSYGIYRSHSQKKV